MPEPVHLQNAKNNGMYHIIKLLVLNELIYEVLRIMRTTVNNELRLVVLMVSKPTWDYLHIYSWFLNDMGLNCVVHIQCIFFSIVNAQYYTTWGWLNTREPHIQRANCRATHRCLAAQKISAPSPSEVNYTHTFIH